jgi:glycosyltransferase involved in cell wall biosynthesis
MVAGAGQSFGIPRILDLDDIDWHIIANETSSTPWSGWKGKVAATLAVRQTKHVVRTLARRFERIWVTNEEDRVELALPGVRVLPNVPFVPPDGPPIRPCPPRPESREIFFIGGLSYAPNQDGISHFLQQIWPVIRERNPHAVLRIGGDRLDAQTRQCWAAHEGVEVLGRVEDLQAEYDRCAFTIAPIRQGAGTKIKVLESLAYGRTCVVTPHAHRGFENILRHGVSLWCGETDESFADGCLRLLDSPDLRNRFADAGNRAVTSKYSIKSFQDEVIATCSRLLETPH